MTICEASLYSKRALVAGDAGKLAANAGVKKFLFIHLPHFGDHDLLVKEAKETYKGEVYLTEDGLTD